MGDENLDGMKIILDTCYGSATSCAVSIFKKLGANVKVINKRVENLKNVKFDIITCRALAKLTQIFNYSHHLAKQNTVFLLHKGINVVDEINEATKCWFFEHELIKNKLEENSFIVKINGLKKIN